MLEVGAACFGRPREETIMRKIRTALAAACILLGTAGAHAEVVTYVLQTPGVT